MQVSEDDKSQTGGKPLTVLLVDDDPMIHAFIKAGLRNTRYEIVSAMDVLDAKKKVAAGKPDIVVTDVMMPGSSGFDLIRDLKASTETDSIPIVLLTSLESEDGSVLDATKRADIRLGKPFSLKNILDCLEKAERLI